MSKRLLAFIQIHIAVFLWGFTAILGKMITLDSILIVFIRMTIASLVYLIMPTTIVQIRNMHRIQIGRIAMIGLIICLHWLCFYYSIKVGNNASLTLSCLGTGPIFALWISQLLILKSRITILQWILSMASIIGVLGIAYGYKGANMSWNPNYIWAIIWGILASILAALFSTLNKFETQSAHPLALSAIEMLSGSLLLALILAWSGRYQPILNTSYIDWLYLLILSVCCTNIPFLLSIVALRYISPLETTLTVNLEPIYGYLFSAILFQEHLGFNHWFWIGSAILLLSVFMMPWIDRQTSELSS